MIKKMVLPMICLVSITAFVVANSFAWFTDDNTKTPTINGSTPTAYYKSGDGSKDNPYVIARPIHLYNFAWLQYMGTYNKDDNGIVKQTYFKIDDYLETDSNGNKVLDMSGYTLPPLGTEDNPFVGEFDGNGTIITNLTISNKLSDYNRHPASITSSNFDSPQVIGLFGVIGATDTSKTYAYSSTTDSLVHDVYAENLTIKNDDTSSNKQTLAGLLAGYVNAPILNCGVGLGTFDLASGTTSLGTYNGTSLKGVSDYALVGSYNSDNFSWDIPDGGSGQDNDFGGSIDMLTFARRISYIKNSAPSTNNYHASFGQGSSGGYAWLSTSTYTDLSEGSYLPVNIDMDTTEMVNVEGTSDTTNSYYSQHTEEPILKTNSGYITGGLARTRVQLCNKDSQGIKNVVKRTSGTSTGTANMDLFSDSDGKVIDKDKLKTNIGILTYYNGNVCAIYDEDDKDFVQSDNFVYKVKSSDVTSKNYVDASTFEKYSSVKSNFLSMIYDSTNAYYTNDGSKTYGVYLAGVRFQQWSTDSTFTATTKWLGEDKTVKFHNNGVQFELKKDEYLTAIVSKYDTSGNFSFYNLYSVDNLEDANLTKINTIHKDSSGNITYNESNDSTKIFDFAPITTTDTGLYSGQLYYFEIPIKKGIYFLSSYGSTYTSGYYPYLLYLDIGANAGDSGDEDDDSSPWPIDFVYFDSNKTLVKISTTKDSSGNYIYKNSEALFQIDSNASGIIKFKRKDGDGSVVYYYISSGSSITVVAIATEGKYEASTSDLTPIYTTSN
jgi:hypothetical protein